MTRLTQTGVLPIGIEVDGVLHRDYTLKPARVIDSIDAVEEVGSHNPIAVVAAVLARQLTQLGSIKPADIHYELVCELDPRDFNALEAAAGELAKKALPEPNDQKPGLVSGLPSPDSGLPGQTAAS